MRPVAADSDTLVVMRFALPFAVLHADLDDRPALRGMLHLLAAAAAVGGAVWLLLIAGSPTAYVGAAIFGTSLMLLYGTSATYHQIAWGTTPRAIVRRLDHAMIFVLIGGTYTPFCLNINLAWGIPLLAVVWSFAGVGALIKVIWPNGPRWLGVTMYLGLSWIGVIGAAEAFRAYATEPIALLILGGAMYTLGAIVYALRRPNPWPRVFGFHEVFHTLVVGGSAAHFAAVAIYVL